MSSQICLLNIVIVLHHDQHKAGSDVGVGWVCFAPCVSVFTGRWLMSFWTGSSKIHELYTAACGLYVCWLSVRGVTVLLAWMPQGRIIIMRKVQEWSLMVSISEQRCVGPKQR